MWRCGGHPCVAVLARRLRFTLTIKQFEKAWKRARVAPGYPNTKSHDLRHGAASEMINAGIDLFTVGCARGHKSVVSTRRYSHLVTERLAAAVEKIGQKMKEPRNPVQGRKTDTPRTRGKGAKSVGLLLQAWCRGRDLNP
ncbi:tyrosine-type recombinase/integrase [Paraburkholderia strydomiana]